MSLEIQKKNIQTSIHDSESLAEELKALEKGIKSPHTYNFDLINRKANLPTLYRSLKEYAENPREDHPLHKTISQSEAWSTYFKKSNKPQPFNK
jgi:hypothetical protein